LVIGGSGGTGSIGVQIASILGANVTAICSTKNIDFVKSLGASEIFDYASSDWKVKLRTAEPYDIIYDTVTSPDDPNYEIITGHKLAKNGNYVAINGDKKDFLTCVAEIATGQKLFRPRYELLCVPQFSKAHFSAIADLTVASSKPLSVTFDTIFPELTTQTLVEAFDKLKTRRVKGKIVIQLKSN